MYEYRRNCINVNYVNKNGDVIDKLFNNKEEVEEFYKHSSDIEFVIHEETLENVKVKN